MCDSNSEIKRSVKLGGALICLAPLLCPILAFLGFSTRIIVELLMLQSDMEFITYGFITAIIRLILALMGALFGGAILLASLNAIKPEKHLYTAYASFGIAFLFGLLVYDLPESVISYLAKLAG